MAAVAAVAGLGISIYGQIKESEDRAAAMEMDAQLRQSQAEEIRRRQQINERIILREAQELQSQQMAAFAAAGVDIGTGAPLMVAEQTMARARERIMLERYEAVFTAEQVRKGAKIQLGLADSARTAGQLGAYGTLLTGVGKTASLADTNTKGSSGDAEARAAGRKSAENYFN